MNPANAVASSNAAPSPATPARWILSPWPAYIASAVLLWALVAALTLLSGVGGIPYVDAQYAWPAAAAAIIYWVVCLAAAYHRKRWWPVEFAVDKVLTLAVGIVVAWFPMALTDRYIARNVNENVDQVLLDSPAADVGDYDCPAHVVMVEVFRRSDGTITYRCVLWGKGGSTWPFFNGGVMAQSKYGKSVQP